MKGWALGAAGLAIALTVSLAPREERPWRTPVALGESHASKAPLQALGLVSPLPSQSSALRLPFEGLVEEVYVRPAERVEQGQRLSRISGEALVSAQREFLRALEERRRSSADAIAPAVEEASAALEAAQRRLELLGVPGAAIAELERSGEVQGAILLTAPRAGLVLERHRAPRFGPGTTLFLITDPSRVQLELEVGASGLREGQRVELRLREPSARRREGRVSSVSASPRGQRLQIELDNADGALTPGATLPLDLYY